MLYKSLFLICLGLCACGTFAWTNKGAFVFLFEWKWSDVALECEQWLGPKGFKAAYVSPPQEHIKGSQWWTRYQPVSYKLVSRSGSESEFQSMVTRCANAGVKIIVDSVINHMAGGSGVGTAGTAYYSNRTYADYGQDDLHHYSYDKSKNCQITNYNDQYNVQFCDLSGLPDLCTGCSYTQSVLGNYLNKLISYGAYGLRVDAAKHMEASELKGVFSKLPSSTYIFQEVIGSSGEAVTESMYYGLGQVTEFGYATEVDNNIIPEYKMQYFNSFGESWGLMPEQYAVVFLDNHDTQRNGQAQLTYKNGDLYKFANIFMLAHPYGFPVIMSSYYFSNFDQGPPSVNVHDGSTLHCTDGSTWVCEHRWTAIANMVNWRNAAGTSAIANWQTGNGNQIAFSRGTTAFIAMNRGSSQWCATLTTSVPSGTYCNVIVSDAISSCPTVSVNNNSVYVCVPGLSAVAIHVNAKK